MKSAKEVVEVFENNESKFLELLFKVTGGGLCHGSLTDILIEGGILEPKTRSGWFSEMSGESLERAAHRNHFPYISRPLRTKFSNLELIKVGSNAETVNVYDYMIELSKVADDTQHIVRVLMGKEKIDGYNHEHNYKSRAAVYNSFRKYFGKGVEFSSFLKKTEIKGLPEYLNQSIYKEFWEAYENNPLNWQGEFLSLVMGDNKVDSRCVGWLKTDSKEQRASAQAELLEMLS